MIYMYVSAFQMMTEYANQLDTIGTLIFIWAVAAIMTVLILQIYCLFARYKQNKHQS